MMQERNVIGSATAAFISPFVNFFEALTPYLIFAIILIVADSRFGIEAARKRGETIRTSRKWRRAINKLVDYICWISLAGVFGQTYNEVVGIPTLSAFVMLIIYCIELTSCFNNYFEYKGINFRISLSGAVKAISRKFTKADISEIIEEKRNETNDNTNS